MGEAPESVFIEGSLEFLKCCDAIVMLKAWESSEGAVAELKRAEELGLEVYYE